MTRFRVHLEDGEIVPAVADTPAEAAAQVRKARKGAIVRKVKRDKSDKVSMRQMTKRHNADRFMREMSVSEELRIARAIHDDFHNEGW